MKALKFTNNDNVNITIDEFEVESNKWTGSTGSFAGMVNALVFEALKIRHKVDVKRLDDKDRKHIMKMTNIMLLTLKNEYEYVIEEFYDKESDR